MKTRKIAVTLALTLVLLLGLAACQSPDSGSPTPTAPADAGPTSASTPTSEPSPTAAPLSDDPLVRITQGNYAYKFTAEGYGDFAFHFHFYEEDPVLGAVFYAGLSNNRVNFAGTYTVEEKDFAYAIYPDRATEQGDADPTEGTAPYTVSFFNWDGEPIGACGFDGEVLYNTMMDDSVIYATGGAPFPYVQYPGGEFDAVFEGELGVSFLSYVADDEVTSTLELYHNFTYMDLVEAMVEGSWSVQTNAEGGYDITLTPFDATDTGAVVSTSADKNTCTYTPEGGAPIAMSNAASGGPVLVHSFEGAFHVDAYNMDAAVSLRLFDDGSCTVSASVAGSEAELDTGSYVLSGHTFSFAFDKGTDAESKVDGTGTITVAVEIPGTRIGDVATELTRVAAETAAPALAHSFSGEFHVAAYNMDAAIVMSLYDDGSCEVVAGVAGNEKVMDSGSYELNGHTFSFAFENGADAESSVDGTGTISVDIEIPGTDLGDIATTLIRDAA